nr:hypothetical protein [uncultured Lelliottia sp.]
MTKFTAGLHELNFLVSSFTPASPKIKATATSQAIPAVTQEIILYMIDEGKFAKLIAGEAHKFFLASMISLERSRQSQQHNLSWQIVEHYYAAYYAVHYLMRVCGYSLTNIDDASLKTITKSSTVPIANPSGGLNTITFSDDCTQVVITKNEKGGGSHKDAWAIWAKILDKIITEAQKDDHEYSSLELTLVMHRNFITTNDHKYNPSDIRGEVNYQFKGDSWCFENNINHRVSTLHKEIVNDSYSLVDTGDRIINLINNNQFIINLARSYFKLSTEQYSYGICRSIQNQYKDKISTLC